MDTIVEIEGEQFLVDSSRTLISNPKAVIIWDEKYSGPIPQELKDKVGFIKKSGSNIVLDSPKYQDSVDSKEESDDYVSLIKSGDLLKEKDQAKINAAIVAVLQNKLL